MSMVQRVLFPETVVRDQDGLWTHSVYAQALKESGCLRDDHPVFAGMEVIDLHLSQLPGVSDEDFLLEWLNWYPDGLDDQGWFPICFGDTGSSYFITLVQPERACRVCGCTWRRACSGGCYWVEEDLCSACRQLGKEAGGLA